MVGIVFYFENYDIDIFSGREIDLSAWNNVCKIANIKKAIIINKTYNKIIPFDADMDIKIVNEFPELTGKITQLVCPWEETPTEKIELWDFDHDTDWYIFGPASGWKEYYGNKFITIPQHGYGASHALHVATTIAYHRFKTIR